jgi:hypothetical protein
LQTFVDRISTWAETPEIDTAAVPLRLLSRFDRLFPSRRSKKDSKLPKIALPGIGFFGWHISRFPILNRNNLQTA